MTDETLDDGNVAATAGMPPTGLQQLELPHDRTPQQQQPKESSPINLMSLDERVEVTVAGLRNKYYLTRKVSEYIQWKNAVSSADTEEIVTLAEDAVRKGKDDLSVVNCAASAVAFPVRETVTDLQASAEAGIAEVVTVHEIGAGETESVSKAAATVTKLSAIQAVTTDATLEAEVSADGETVVALAVEKQVNVDQHSVNKSVDEEEAANVHTAVASICKATEQTAAATAITVLDTSSSIFANST